MMTKFHLKKLKHNIYAFLSLAGTSNRYHLRGLGDEGRAAQGHGEELFAVRRGADTDEAATHRLTEGRKDGIRLRTCAMWMGV